MTLNVRAREPAVEGESGVEPAFLPKRETWEFYVTPKEHFAWLEPQLRPPSPVVRRLEFDVNCADSATSSLVATLQTAYTVRVRELRYPGRPSDAAHAAGKWAYVFRGGKLAVEAHCIQGDTWDGWTVLGGDRRPWRSVRGLQLDPGPSGRRHTYSYFLSPVQLSREVIEDIEGGGLKLSASATECECDCYDKSVLVPDPLRWACDVQEQYYQPRLRALEAWECDGGLVAYDFVARVLKTWIDNGDKVGAKNELRRQPESWLEARAEGIRGARRRAEEAAAYLAHCLRAPEYVAVERTCRAKGGEELELATVCLAAALADILVTQPGRRLALDLVSDSKRLPRQLLFQDDGPKLPDEWFARYRFGQKGLLGVFRELVPAFIELELLAAKGVVAKEVEEVEEAQTAAAERDAKGARARRIEESLALKERARKHLENLGAKTKLSKRKVRILERLQQGKPITTGTRRNGKKWAKLMEEWGELSELEEVKHPPKVPTKAEAKVGGLERLAKRYEPYEKYAKGLTSTLGTVVEIINLTFAVQELWKARETDTAEWEKKKLSAIGALSDMVEHGGGMAGLLLHDGLDAVRRTRMSTVVELSKTAGYFGGVVGGVIDMLDYEEQAFAAAEEYDYGKLVGRSMQMAGAAGAAAGSAMGVVGLVVEAGGWGSALGPWGSAVGAAGGVLVGGGFLVARWLSLNANEVFASRCFLGKNSDEVEQELSWSRYRMPTKDPQEEIGALVALLSQFRLMCFAGLDDWRVLIHPGYLEAGSSYEVQVANRWANAHPEDYSIVVDMDTGDLRQTGGPPLKEGEVKRDASGEVEYILINTQGVQPPVNPLRQYRNTSVKVRLMHTKEGMAPKQRVPGDEEKFSAVEIRLPSTDPVFSLDPSTWVSTGEE